MKSSTNDLIVYGNPILFWALMGTMLGLISCGVRAVGEAAALSRAGARLKLASRTPRRAKRPATKKPGGRPAWM